MIVVGKPLMARLSYHQRKRAAVKWCGKVLR
jgi:hypothetical protein